MTIVAFFNNKGGVGKTSLAYHLAWMFADRGLRVIVADLDPQANLTSMFLDEDRLMEVWPDDPARPLTIAGVVHPIIEGIGDIADPHVEEIADGLGLVIGDLLLSLFEDHLSESWPKCLAGDPAAFRVTTAFYRTIVAAKRAFTADLALIDVGPNLGALNRAALIAAEHVVVPLAPDLFSLQGLRNLGPRLRGWRADWRKRLEERDRISFDLPSGRMAPAGYVVMQHAVRLDRPVKAYRNWIERIPSEYRRAVLNEVPAGTVAVADDAQCLAQLKHYRSLMPFAMEAQKPMFHLKPADGAIGAHMAAVRECGRDFRRLSDRIAAAVGIAMPLPLE